MEKQRNKLNQSQQILEDEKKSQLSRIKQLETKND
jgi:hypothetical protein